MNPRIFFSTWHLVAVDASSHKSTLHERLTDVAHW
jgi:hypothetical protein